jgi:serine phosphatase RsbU (regulator of sigma subunit)
MANAGHLFPYSNGTEIAVETGMPLGIATEADYADTTVRLNPGDNITFLSDGVVEARKADGELFGFERAQAISVRSPQEIADAAQQFGQEDDITVLTLTLAPAV